jgi:glycosyltransferase involved in cell wall biosynthesis
MARPVIASDHGGAVETIENNVSGLLVPPGDAATLAAAIDYILDLSAEERAAFGAQGRAAVVARFTVRAMQAATIEVYREVLR